MSRLLGLVPLVALLAACSVVSDFSPEHAFDMPSPTEKGYAALAAGNNPEAIRWLTVASRDNPDDPYLMIDLAAAYQRLARFEDAKKLYQTLVDTGLDVKAEKVTDPKLQGKSIAQVAAADLAICSPCDMPAEGGKGYRAFSEGDYPGAAKWLAIASTAKPDDAYLMVDLAAAYRQIDKIDEARKLYQTVIDKAAVPAPKAPDTKVADTPPVVQPAEAQPAGAKRSGGHGGMMAADPKPADATPADAKPHAKTLAEIAAADLARLPK